MTQPLPLLVGMLAVHDTSIATTTLVGVLAVQSILDRQEKIVEEVNCSVRG